MHVQQTDYEGSTSIGLYGFTTDTYAVLPPDFKHVNVLDVDVVETTVNYSALNGLYLAGNTSGLAVSDILYPPELETLTSHFNLAVLDTKHTALGNLVLCNDNGAYISPFLEPCRDTLEDVLNVPTTSGTVAGLNIVGSCGVATNKGVLLHRDATDEELERVEDALNVSADIGSVNFGSPYIKAGLVANTHGYLTGTDTTAVEIQRIDETLGFL